MFQVPSSEFRATDHRRKRLCINGSCLAICHQSGTVRDTRDFTSGSPIQTIAAVLPDPSPELALSRSTPSIGITRTHCHTCATLLDRTLVNNRRVCECAELLPQLQGPTRADLHHQDPY